MLTEFRSAEESAVVARRMLEAIEQLLIADRPDWVLVYGDTNSTLAGARFPYADVDFQMAAREIRAKFTGGFEELPGSLLTAAAMALPSRVSACPGT